MREIVEYFERGALERDLNTRLTSLRERNGNYDQYTDGFDEAVDRVENFPAAANVAPVVYGRWINGDPYCPVCKKDKFADLDADVWADWQPDYCPNCGAKMDGGDSDMETAPDGFCSHGEPREGNN